MAGKDAASLTPFGDMLTAPDGQAEKLDDAVARPANGAIETYAENIPSDRY
ncbi:MAG: hypothetical protein JO001_21375 [Alphaproteobacteria bacterium]|nr:hypothetical protein [Alphaproteobacteria bacterium]